MNKKQLEEFENCGTCGYLAERFAMPSRISCVEVVEVRKKKNE